jgi:hypothetical protein
VSDHAATQGERQRHGPGTLHYHDNHLIGCGRLLEFEPRNLRVRL